MAYLLEPVGLAETDNAVFLALVGTPRRTAAEIAEEVELPLPSVRDSLRTLSDSGLVTMLLSRPVRYVVAPPEVAIEALVSRKQQELEGLRADARQLALKVRETAASGGAEGMVELIEGREAILHTMARLQLGAHDNVRLIDAPPYIMGTPVQNEEELVALARGVSYRSLYHAPALELAGHYQQMMQCVDAGEEARTIASAPMKMLIVDHSVAMLPVSFSPTETKTRMLVHAPPLVEALTLTFDALWARGTPITRRAEAAVGMSERDRQILSLVASGMKDQAIARALGIAQRTVVRRIADMMSELGADTRFQAGILAARKGWI